MESELPTESLIPTLPTVAMVPQPVGLNWEPMTQEVLEWASWKQERNERKVSELMEKEGEKAKEEEKSIIATVVSHAIKTSVNNHTYLFNNEIRRIDSGCSHRCHGSVKDDSMGQEVSRDIDSCQL